MNSQPAHLLEALFPAKARRAVLEALFQGTEEVLTTSALARRAHLTPRAVAVEIQRLEEVGLVHVEVVGAAKIVRPASGSAVARCLGELLKAVQEPPPPEVSPTMVRQSLAAHGAPLPERPAMKLPLHEALLQGLKLARRDATVLRVLPVVLRRNAAKLDWSALNERARRRHDLALMKAARGSTHDQDAVESMHRLAKLDLETLVGRYYETRLQKTGPEADFRTSFLVLIDRLFGPEQAARIEKRLLTQPPPPVVSPYTGDHYALLSRAPPGGSRSCGRPLRPVR